VIDARRGGRGRLWDAAKKTTLEGARARSRGGTGSALAECLSTTLMANRLASLRHPIGRIGSSPACGWPVITHPDASRICRTCTCLH
jgi:hypothetical protein